MSISERFEVLSKFAGNQTKLANEIGVTNAAISKIVAKGGQVRSDTLEAILKVYPTLNARWLLTGEGPMWLDEEEAKRVSAEPDHKKVPELERKLEEQQKKLDEQQEAFNRMAKMMEKQVKMLEREIIKRDPESARAIGLLDDE